MMKSEIISAALDELIEKFYMSPESFELVAYNEYTTIQDNLDSIIWRTKINSGELLIEDPTTQQRTILVEHLIKNKIIRVAIFNNCNWTSSILHNAKSDATIESKKLFMRFSSNYRKFNKLKNLIKNHNENKETREFLKKLSTSLPGVIDNHIFGK